MRRYSIDSVLKKVFITAGIIKFSVLLSFSQTDSVENAQIYYYPDGSIASSGNMKDGKPNGTWTSFYPNGTKKSLGEWRNGELNGEWSFFYPDGKRQKSLYYLDGVKHGTSVEYQIVYEKGEYKEKLLSKEIFQNGERIGKGQYYNSRGCLERVIPFKNGEFSGMGVKLDCDSNFIEVMYFREGKIIESYPINRKDSLSNKDGKWLSFDNFFAVTEEVNYKNGEKHGWHRKYLPNGDIEFSLLFQDGEMHLTQSTVGFDYIEYADSTGSVFGGTFFKEIPIGIHVKLKSTEISDCIEYSTKGKVIGKGKCNQKAKKEGGWETYAESGNIDSRGSFINDFKTGKWIFLYHNGSIEQQGNYVNGKEHGEWKWFFPNGKLRKVENYRYGVREGSYMEFDSLENVIVKGFFADNMEEGEWEVRLGDIIWKGIYNFGELSGEIVSAYKNGNLFFKGSFINGNPEGRHKYYYENGEMKEEQIWDMGERIGTWRKFNYLGEPIISITYRNGEEYLINGVKVRY